MSGEDTRYIRIPISIPLSTVQTALAEDTASRAKYDPQMGVQQENDLSWLIEDENEPDTCTVQDPVITPIDTNTTAIHLDDTDYAFPQGDCDLGARHPLRYNREKIQSGGNSLSQDMNHSPSSAYHGEIHIVIHPVFQVPCPYLRLWTSAGTLIGLDFLQQMIDRFNFVPIGTQPILQSHSSMNAPLGDIKEIWQGNQLASAVASGFNFDADIIDGNSYSIGQSSKAIMPSRGDDMDYRLYQFGRLVLDMHPILDTPFYTLHMCDMEHVLGTKLLNTDAKFNFRSSATSAKFIGGETAREPSQGEDSGTGTKVPQKPSGEDSGTGTKVPQKPSGEDSGTGTKVPQKPSGEEGYFPSRSSIVGQRLNPKSAVESIKGASTATATASSASNISVGDRGYMLAWLTHVGPHIGIKVPPQLFVHACSTFGIPAATDIYFTKSG